MKGVDKMDKQIDFVKMIKKVRMHSLALKSSILCNKDRRNMIKNTQACILNMDTDSENDVKMNHVLSSNSMTSQKNVQHGFCVDNEDLITKNIEQRILKHKPNCSCEAFWKYKTDEKIDNTFVGNKVLAVHNSNFKTKSAVFQFLKEYRHFKKSAQKINKFKKGERSFDETEMVQTARQKNPSPVVPKGNIY